MPACRSTNFGRFCKGSDNSLDRLLEKPQERDSRTVIAYAYRPDRRAHNDRRFEPGAIAAVGISASESPSEH